MSKKHIHIITPEQKMTVQLWLGVILAIFGVVLLTISFFFPPAGVIDASVLAAIGEVFTFSGALIGIDYTYKYKVYKKLQDEDNNQEDIQ